MAARTDPQPTRNGPDPTHPTVVAHELLAGGDAEGACQALTAYVARRPGDVRGWLLLSYAARAAGDPIRAAHAARRAADVRTGSLALTVTQALCLVRAGLRRDAEAHLAGLSADQLADGQTCMQLAQVHEALGQHDRALMGFRRAVVLRPDDPGIRLQAAVRLERAQAAEEARDHAQFLLDHFPEIPDAERLMVRLDHHAGRITEARARATRLLNRPDLPAPIRRSTCMELARIAARAGFPREAFDAAREGNRLTLQQWLREPGNDLDAFPQALQEIRALQDQGPPVVFEPSPTPAPVLLVGFPRSGTTLMHHILSAHPDLVAVEEQPLLDEAIAVALGAGVGYREALARTAHDADRRRLRDCYLKRLHERAGPAHGPRTRWIDKLPLNLTRIELLHRMLPDAPVLVMLRDPRDCVLSAFMQDFSLNDAMAQCADLGRCARMYEDVMGIWQRARRHPTLRYHEQRYEDLLAAPETELRALLAFLEVPWNEAVLHHDQPTRRQTFLTPSYHDVSQKLYRRAVRRFEAFSEQLAPALPILAPHIEAFGYGSGPKPAASRPQSR